MNRKILSLILACAMSLTLLSACGSKPAAPAQKKVDLDAFHTATLEKHEYMDIMELADGEMQEMFYPGLAAVETEQCLVYVNMMSMNMGEMVLVEVKDAKDVDTVKQILQDRIDGMINGGAWYPEPTEMWTNNSAVVSNGNYVMMVVHEDVKAITDEFNALF